LRHVTFARRTYNLPWYDDIPGPNLEDRQRLLEAIQRAGKVYYPILVDQHNNIIDGMNRLEIAAELGLSDRNVTFEHITCKDEDDARRLCFELNFGRRHLDRDQIKETVATYLSLFPQESDRKVAKKTGASRRAVGRVRQKLEETGNLSPQEERVGRDGKTQKKGARSRKPAAANGKPEKAEDNGNPAVLKDAHGTVVPAGLIDVFSDRAIPEAVAWCEGLIAEMGKRRYLNDIRKRLKSFLFMRHVDLENHLDRMQQEAEVLLEVLKHGQADLVCEWCHGQGCDNCLGQGHMPLNRHEELKAEGKL
jgi:hypothetical protein